MDHSAQGRQCGCAVARSSEAKGTAKEPYVNHLLEVALLVAEASGGANLDIVIAALLHDATRIRKFRARSSPQLLAAD